MASRTANTNNELIAMAKIVFFAFRDHPLCFVHVLLNGLDMETKGLDGKIILEGESVRLVALMAEPSHFLHALYRQAKGKNLFLGACRACANKLQAVEALEKEGIPLIGDLAGHPAMADFINRGYTVLTF